MFQAKKSALSRRRVLRGIAASAMLGSLTAEAAQHVHQAAAESRPTGGAYKPKALKAQEFKTLAVLCELIIPGAKEAGAAEFIDTLASGSKQLLGIYTAGLLWLDTEMRRRYETTFAAAPADKQTAMLDLIAYRKEKAADLEPGIRFFDWARRMTVDAYFTSKVGIEALGYKGNAGMKEFHVPVAALEYALKRSPA